MHTRLELTTDREKRRLYEDDIAFREGVSDGWDRWGDRTEELLGRVTFVLFKPDAIAARRVDAGLRWLRGRGFRAIAARVLRLDRHVVREIWRYQLNAAPLATLAAVDICATAADSLFVALRDDGAVARTAASRRLSAMKGSSRPAARAPHELRAQIGGTTQLFNAVHVPDEPADLLRELAVLFPAGPRVELLDQIAAGLESGETPPMTPICASDDVVHARSSDVLSALRRLADAAPPHSEEVRVIARLLEGAGDAPDMPDAELVALIRWLDLLPHVLSRWDRAVIAAHLVDPLRPQRRPLVGALLDDERQRLQPPHPEQRLALGHTAVQREASGTPN